MPAVGLQQKGAEPLDGPVPPCDLEVAQVDGFRFVYLLPWTASSLLIERHPLMRAMRVDTITLAALAATLDLHEDPRRTSDLPVWSLLRASMDTLRARARRIADAVHPAGVVARVEPSRAYLGGGSVPAHRIESVAVTLRRPDIPEEELARRLRLGDPPVVPRVHDGEVHLDLRTVFPEQDEKLIAAILAAIG